MGFTCLSWDWLPGCSGSNDMSSDYQTTSNSFYSMRLKTLKPKLRMESSMSCSIKGLQYLAKSPRASGVPIASSTVSFLSIRIVSIWFTLLYRSVLEHGSEKHRRMTLDHLLDGLLEFATNEQGSKSLTKALKEGGLDTLDKVVRRMCESAKG